MAANNETLKKFIWEGRDERGEKLSGEIDAHNVAAAKAVLRVKKIQIFKIIKKKMPLFSSRKKITVKDVTIFTRQLATMLTAGIPLVQSFDIVGKSHPNPKMITLVEKIKAEVEEGHTFSNALQHHPNLFDPLFCSLIGMGEQVGALDKVLDRLASYKEKTETLKAKIKKALIYPAAIVTVALIVTTVILVFVIPQFEELFHGFGADLPYPTMIVVSLSKFVTNYWWILLGGIIGTIYSMYFLYTNRPKFRYFIERNSLKLPLFGKMLTKAAVARFARTLSTTFSAGIPIAEALDSVAPATGNIVFESATKQIRHEISHGQQLNRAIQNVKCFPEMVVQMVAIGEESGALDAMLNKVADYYEEEVDNTVDAISTLIEPILMVVLGVIIGGLIIAMYLPIFKMGAVV